MSGIFDCFLCFVLAKLKGDSAWEGEVLGCLPRSWAHGWEQKRGAGKPRPQETMVLKQLTPSNSGANHSAHTSGFFYKSRRIEKNKIQKETILFVKSQVA